MVTKESFVSIAWAPRAVLGTPMEARLPGVCENTSNLNHCHIALQK